MTGRKGKQLEALAKKLLMEHFRTTLVFKLINTERMDFIVIDFEGVIHLVEAKQTKKKFYYPKSSEKKRTQLMKYISTIKHIRSITMTPNSKFWMLVRLRGKLYFNNFEELHEIPTCIEIQNGDTNQP